MTERRCITWVILIALISHGIVAYLHILYGGQNIDEGFYALAARAVCRGELPFRDFGYTQMPLLPYVNGAFLKFIGYGIFQQRAVNGVWALLTLMAGGWWLARRTGIVWAVLFISVLTVSPFWMYFTHLGKTYALTGLTVMAGFLVFSECRAGVKRTVLLALIGTVGVGCRLSVGPFFAVLWIGSFLEHRLSSWRQYAAALAGSFLCPVVLLLPFYLAAPESAYFWSVDFFVISVPNRTWHQTWRDICAIAPALWLSVALGLGHAVLSGKTTFRFREWVVACATLGALVANVLPQGAYDEYGTPFIPILALVAGLGMWELSEKIPMLKTPIFPVSLWAVNLGLGVALLWGGIPQDRYGTWSLLLPLNAPAYNRLLPENIFHASQVVRNYLPHGRPFLGPHLILAAETDSEVPRELRMGAFSITTEYPPAKAKQLNLATPDDVRRYLADPRIPVLAFTKNAVLNYNYSVPSGALSKQMVEGTAKLSENFMVAYEDAEFFILVRKNAQPVTREP